MIYLGGSYIEPEAVIEVRLAHTIEPHDLAGVTAMVHMSRVQVDPFDCIFPWEDPDAAERRLHAVAAQIHEAQRTAALGIIASEEDE